MNNTNPSIPQSVVDQQEPTRLRDEYQSRCSHQDARGEWNIGLQRNFPDRQTRGICLFCQLVIYPQHWISDGPNKMKLVSSHPLYHIVRKIDACSEQAGNQTTVPAVPDIDAPRVPKPLTFWQKRLRRARSRAEKIIEPNGFSYRTDPAEIMAAYKEETVRRFGTVQADQLPINTPSVESVMPRATFRYWKIRILHFLRIK